MEDKLGVPWGHANTHLHTLTGGLCWYRSVLLQGLGAKPMLAEKISISCGAALAFSPDQCSIYLPSVWLSFFPMPPFTTIAAWMHVWITVSTIHSHIWQYTMRCALDCMNTWTPQFHILFLASFLCSLRTASLLIESKSGIHWGTAASRSGHDDLKSRKKKKKKWTHMACKSTDHLSIRM